MNCQKLCSLLLLITFGCQPALAGRLWHKKEALPAHTLLKPSLPSNSLFYELDETLAKNALFQLSPDPSVSTTIELPVADGTFHSFMVRYTPVMPEELAGRYPALRTFTGIAADNPAVTAKIDFTDYGLHAVIFNGQEVSLVDPVGNSPTTLYSVHFKRDEIKNVDYQHPCMVEHPHAVTGHPIPGHRSGMRTANGTILKTFRLALACDHQYADSVTGSTNPTISQVLSKMLTTLNRVNGVYERELAITMVLVTQEDTLIFNQASGGPNGDDPFTTIDTEAIPCLEANQLLCDARIGGQNYDLGHVFTTGAGGYSLVGVSCQDGIKAKSVTGQHHPWGDGFDIDYVAHEIGHEFGGDHPFNFAGGGSCNFNTIYEETAYEPGSGSTIMAYAGICPPADLQPHSDPYFNSINLQEIFTYTSTFGGVCATTSPTGNVPVTMPAFTASYTIPFQTPFELTAPNAVTSVADTSITYCWEQYNLGEYGQDLSGTHVYGPLFRSYLPVKSPTRIFPKISLVLADSASNAGIENDEGEKLPDSARYLTFRLTVRNIYQGTGCYLVPDDTIHLDVINTGAGFSVTSQDILSYVYFGGTPMDITWYTAGTNLPPISDSSVDIYLSMDGGLTWPVFLGNFPNTGSATATVPNPDSVVSKARVKVKGSGNVFFNVCKSSFVIQPTTASDTSVRIFPSPANHFLLIYAGNRGGLRYEIFSVTGKKITEGTVDGGTDVDVQNWARGVYLIRIYDASGNKTIRKFVVE